MKIIKESTTWLYMVFSLFFIILAIGTYLNQHYAREKFSTSPLHSNDIWSNWDSMLVQYVGEVVDTYDQSSLIHKLALPRPVGSKQHAKTIELISRTLKQTQMQVFHNTFHTNTVVGMQTFTNIIAINNLKATSFVILAAHFDSKRTAKNVHREKFSGASDAAASCGILLALAKLISKRREMATASPLGIIFIFLDGEEAFKNWSPHDSLYGSRHLAKLFSNRQHMLKPSELQLIGYDQSDGDQETWAFSTSSISLFILLDLLGADDNMPVLSFFQNTHMEFLKLLNITRLVDQYLSREEFKSIRWQTETAYQLMAQEFASVQVVEDDHLPFAQLGMPILLLLPVPFPRYWHTLEDTVASLNNRALYHWTISLFLYLLTKYDHAILGDTLNLGKNYPKW